MEGGVDLPAVVSLLMGILRLEILTEMAKMTYFHPGPKLKNCGFYMIMANGGNGLNGGGPPTGYLLEIFGLNILINSSSQVKVFGQGHYNSALPMKTIPNRMGAVTEYQNEIKSISNPKTT